MGAHAIVAATAVAACGLLAGARPLRPQVIAVLLPATLWGLGFGRLLRPGPGTGSRTAAIAIALASLAFTCFAHPLIRGSYRAWDFESYFEERAPFEAAVRGTVENTLTLGALLLGGLILAFAVSALPLAAARVQRAVIRVDRIRAGRAIGRVGALGIVLATFVPVVVLWIDSPDDPEQYIVRYASLATLIAECVRRGRFGSLGLALPPLTALAGLAVPAARRTVDRTLAVFALVFSSLELTMAAASAAPARWRLLGVSVRSASRAVARALGLAGAPLPETLVLHALVVTFLAAAWTAAQVLKSPKGAQGLS